MKRIIICADGTWNRPEQDLKKDFPTNVLRIARSIKPFTRQGIPQQVFYDWGIGSYYDAVIGGATGRGINKNIMDNYRYIVQNYKPGDEIYLFGFSRGAYTVRCLSGLINNCGILKRENARFIQQAFDLYKKKGKRHKPGGQISKDFREEYSHRSRKIKFIGVWDTVGSLGIPFSFLGLLDDSDQFYDTEIGANVEIARHAMAIDERRTDFIPTIWDHKTGLDLKQVWFAGVHGDIGGSYKPDANGELLSDIPLQWMIEEAHEAGLRVETFLPKSLNPSYQASLHKSRKHIYRRKKPYERPLEHGKSELLIHRTVKERWEDTALKYRPAKLVEYLQANDEQWPALV